MSLSAVRDAAIDSTFDLLGTSMTATPPGKGPVSLKVVWDAPLLEDAGRGRQLGRVFWVKTEDLAEVPRGTTFVGPEPHGGANKTWRVDQRLAIEPGKIQVLVTEVLE